MDDDKLTVGREFPNECSVAQHLVRVFRYLFSAVAHVGYVVVRQDFGGDQVSLVESTACVKWRPISVGSGSDRTIIRESDVWANQLPAMSWIGRGNVMWWSPWMIAKQNLGRPLEQGKSDALKSILTRHTHWITFGFLLGCGRG